MAETVTVEEASAEQLRRFATEVMNLELGGRETRDMVVGKLSEIGYTAPFINLPDRADPTARAHPGRHISERVTNSGVTEYCINVHVGRDKGGDRPIFVSVNGRAMWIPRGEDVWVPAHLVEALEHSEEFEYDESEKGLGRPRRVRSYPFSYV